MRPFPVAILALSALSPVVHARTGAAVMTRHATGTFEVVITPEAHGPAPTDGVPTGRMGLFKTFSGDLAGTATGTMLSAGTPRKGVAATYVAIDQFQGRLDGHAGGFILAHRGTMDKAGHADLTVAISPDSGTGDLAGIAGSLSIDVRDGVHHYDLTYTLPAR